MVVTLYGIVVTEIHQSFQKGNIGSDCEREMLTTSSDCVVICFDEEGVAGVTDSAAGK